MSSQSSEASVLSPTLSASSTESARPTPHSHDDGRTASAQTHTCTRRGIPVSLPGGGLDCCVDCVRVKGAARGNYLLEPDVHYEINESFDHRLCWFKYVDRLPRGDHIPAKLNRYELAYHSEDTPWAVNVQQRTLFYLAQTPAAERTKFWAALTSPNIGHPCRIVNNVIFVNFAQPRDYQFALKGARFVDGAALLKVVPKPSDYSCQPLAASVEASYFLKRYPLHVEQDGRSQLAIEPLARYIEGGEDSVLSIFGQYASMESSAPDQMLFSSVVGPMPGLDDLFNVGVRLRDGGARFPIVSRGQSRKRFQVPGNVFCHAAFGDYEMMDRLVQMDKAEAKKTREVNVRGEIPAGQQDLVLRVIPHSGGVFAELEHAFRQHGSFEPIRDDEWKRFDVPIVDEWVVRYILNLARQSYGHHENLL